MTSLGVVVIVLSVLVAATAGYAWVQWRQLARVREVAEAIALAARTGSSTLIVEELAEGSAAAEVAEGARQLLVRARRPAAPPPPIRPAPAAAPAPRRDPLFRALVDRVQESVVVHRDRILFVNPAFAHLIGQPPEKIVGRTLADLVTPEYAGLVEANLGRRIAGDEAPAVCEIEIADAHGQVTRLELTGSNLDIDGQRTVLYTAVEMLPHAAPAVLAVPAAAPVAPDSGRALLTLDSLTDGLICTDAAGAIEFLNQSAARMAGVTPAEAQGRRVEDLFGFVDEIDRRALADPVQQCLAAGMPASLGRRALMTARRNNQEFGIEATAAPIRAVEGELLGVALTLHDVSELRGLTRQMTYQASHDALTGLVNRREFERRLAEALESLRHGVHSHVLCYLDLDRFKAVNDTCGHMAGDSMLREVASLIRDAVRDSDTVARLGGDEFGLLLSGCPLDKARQIADDVCRAVTSYRFVWKDRIFAIGVSIGLVEVGRESGSVEEVLAAADSACYVAKNQSGGRVHVYSARDEVLARHRGEIQWLQRLQAALRDGHFELYVQQIVSMQAAAPAGLAFEVFVRLTDEVGKPVAPGEFMAAAERYRLMSLVDRWVVQTAFAALSNGRLLLPEGCAMSINLCSQSLGDPSFLEFVVDTLDRTGVRPSQVCFELSETTVSTNIEHARRFIGVLHGMGCQFALDDFGTDLGAFAKLKNLAMDYLKIDGSYIHNLGRDSVNQAMVAATIRLARTLSFRVVAEQVEDPAALEAARGMGIDFAQGYAVGRPEPLRTAA